jgi:ABC-2 type transport system ATP-binding protein
VSAVIEVRGLRKAFGRSAALDGLDLTVTAGSVHGFLGPNGAGKSTTIRILLGLLRPDAGEVTVLRTDPWASAVALHRRLAYVPGDVMLWPTLSGGEIIDLLARLHGSPRADRRAELIERFALDPAKKARAYSRGNRQKVALVAALSTESELLLLDEPTAGLDPVMEEIFREVIRERSAEGCTVLLSSHILSEVEALCDDVTIISAGRTVDSGSLRQLRHLSRTGLTAELDSVPPGLAELPGVHDVSVSGTVIRCHVDDTALSPLLQRLAAHGVRTLTCAPPTLEELFLRHYRTEGGTAAASA